MLLPFASFSLHLCLPPPVSHHYFSRMHGSISFCVHSKPGSTGTETHTDYSSCTCFQNFLVEFHPSIEIILLQLEVGSLMLPTLLPNLLLLCLCLALLGFFSERSGKFWLIRRYSKLQGRFCFVVEIPLKVELVVSKVWTEE